ncbi:hypothetical protein BGZ83_004714, partial [Gryganskiella cystojenkinii]
VYDATLTQKQTGVTYVTQLLYNSEEHVYYVYVRSGETDYKLDGPHKTIEEAKTAYQVSYHDNFGVEWTERETAVNDSWSYEVKTYETFEETEEIEEVVDETEVATLIVREEKALDEKKEIKVETTTISAAAEVSVEQVTKEETVVVEEEKEQVKEVVVTKETGVVAKPAVSKGSSWFRRLATGVAVGAGAVASGAGSAASGALNKVDGVWKRTVQVLTTRKAHVDKVVPFHKHAFVYYDDE